MAINYLGTEDGCTKNYDKILEYTFKRVILSNNVIGKIRKIADDRP